VTIEALLDRGVIIHCPEATIIGTEVNPDRFEAGVEIYPSTTVVGAESLYRAGTKLGKAGGGYFNNVRAGRNCDLFGGYFDDCVFLDGVVVRGHSEVRGGTLLEEGCEAAHHCGYKMTVMLPFVVAGSLINFCDAFFAGGTSRKDHSEIGSCLALYNYTPWSDKFASQFGDVASGVFMRSPRIFVGGQTQVVSPVHVDYGSVIPAGCAVRRSVPAGRLYGERMIPTDMPFDPTLYGGLAPKFALTRQYVGNLRALQAWYATVRRPNADGALEAALLDAAVAQIEAGINERIKRLGKIIDKLPASREQHATALAGALPKAMPLHRKRIVEHDALTSGWADLKATLHAPFDTTGAGLDALEEIGVRRGGGDYFVFLKELPDELIERGTSSLQSVVDAYC
jgi:UDP-N-acetylglucosamine/UDP-N-acetylgalactosamine diphosphorylase